jgi:hypothetical protein
MPEITLASEAVEWNMSVALRGVKALHVTF